MPNLKRASKWPNNILEDILMYQDIKVNELPGDANKSLEYLLSRIHPNQRQVLLWFYKDGYKVNEMTKLEGGFTYLYATACKKNGIKNLQRLSYLLTIGYDSFVERCNIKEYPISLFFKDLFAISYNALERAGIMTVGDVLGYSKNELMQFDRVGEFTIEKMERKLNECGLYLKA